MTKLPIRGSINLFSLKTTEKSNQKEEEMMEVAPVVNS